jgi:8-oxo-dGTP pyrophosphatase MutT (NUDIX family)
MSDSSRRLGTWDEPEQPWTTLTNERPYVTPWLAIRRDTVRTHTGDEITYSYMERPNCVAIVPVTTSGNMLMLRQYRYPIRAWCWEIPMGGIEDGEDPEATVNRELLEEAGGRATSVRYVTTYYTANGAVRQQCMVYLAEGVEQQQTDHEPTELIHVTTLPVAEVLRMAHAGEITDSLSALSILLCEPYLK